MTVLLLAGTADEKSRCAALLDAAGEQLRARLCIDPVNSCTGVMFEGNNDEHPNGRRYQALKGQMRQETPAT